MIWYALITLCLILPIMAIAVDLTILYTVQARLSAAVDGAALGAGRLLGTETGNAAAPVEAIAGEFVLANFPTGYWGAPALTSGSGTAANTYDVVYTTPVPGSYQIAVTANVQVPLIFARIFNVNNAAVAAAATATRKSSRIMYVLDRSGSMTNIISGGSTSCWESVKQLAIEYAAEASPGVDELGAIVFDSTATVAYPVYLTTTTPYQGYISGTPNVPSTGGPDTSFINLSTDAGRNGQTGCSDMLCMIYQTNAGGNTGMSEGLDLAYIELQKAHLRDLATDGADGRMNTVVLFTDGVPNFISAYLNDPNHNSTGSNLTTEPTDWMLKPCTKTLTTGCTYCTYRSATTFSGTGDNRMIQVLGASDTMMSGSVTGGMQLWATDTKSSVLQWVAEQSPTYTGSNDESEENATPAYNGCTQANHWQELYQIPPLDYYGTSTYPRSTTSPGYQNSTLPGFVYHTWSTGPATAVTSDYYWGIAAWTAVDNIGYNMRTDSNQSARGDGTSTTDFNHHMPIALYTIGYEGNGGVDAALLKRVANTTDSTSYDSTQQVGVYYPAADAADIANALSSIMSSVLRLAQ
jgi:hypothetical protein